MVASEEGGPSATDNAMGGPSPFDTGTETPNQGAYVPFEPYEWANVCNNYADFLAEQGDDAEYVAFTRHQLINTPQSMQQQRLGTMARTAPILSHYVQRGGAAFGMLHKLWPSRTAGGAGEPSGARPAAPQLASAEC